MSSSYSEDKLVEQPAISLFGEMRWDTLDCYNETYGSDGTLGREHRGEIVLKSKLPVKVIACIEDPVVIKKILTHLDEKAAVTETTRLPECRAPPQPGVFELG